MAFINVAGWKPEQVAEWMRGLDDVILPYVHFMLNAGINGKQLLTLTAGQLQQLNITKIGHQELILESVELLCNLHYSLESENIQYLASQLSCRCTSLKNRLQDKQCANGSTPCRLPVLTLSNLSEVMIAIKDIVTWLDRPPFDDIENLVILRGQLLNAGIDMAIVMTESDIGTARNTLKNLSQTVAEKCDSLVQDCDDPLIIQPASLELATIRRKPDEELGMHIQSSYYGTHVISGVKEQSPADVCGKIEEGDEVLQIHYQTVVGWHLKKIVNELKKKPKEVVLTLKKSPRHSNMFGSAIPNKRRPKLKQSTFPKLQKKHSREDCHNLRSPLPQEFLSGQKMDLLEPESPSPKDKTDTEDECEVFRSGSESPSYLQLEAGPKARRATVSGPGSPALKRPSLKVNALGNRLRANNTGNTLTVSNHERFQKTRSFAFGEKFDDIHHIDSPIGSPAMMKKFTTTIVKKPAESVAGASDPALGRIKPIEDHPSPATDNTSEKPKLTRFSDEKPQIIEPERCVVVLGKEVTLRRKLGKKPKVSKRKTRYKELGTTDCEGVMNKKFPNGSWHKHWCVLKDRFFYCYKNSEDSQAKVCMCLDGFRISPYESKSKHHAFKIHNAGTEFIFACDSKEDNVRWMVKLQQATLESSASNHPVEQGYVSQSDDSDSEEAKKTIHGTDIQDSATKDSDLSELAKTIKDGALTIDGQDIQNKRRTILSRHLCDDTQPNQELDLQIKQRTLKAKEMELKEIEDLLHMDKFPYQKLKEFKNRHLQHDEKLPVQTVESASNMDNKKRADKKTIKGASEQKTRLNSVSNSNRDKLVSMRDQKRVEETDL